MSRVVSTLTTTFQHCCWINVEQNGQKLVGPTELQVNFRNMSDLEARVCAILDVMVTATMSEMDKVIGSSDPNEAPAWTENKQTSCLDQKVAESPLVSVLVLVLVASPFPGIQTNS